MVQRESVVSAAVSLVLHGAVIALMYWLFAGEAVPEVRVPEPREIEVAIAPPERAVPLALPPVASPARPAPAGRRGPRRSALPPSVDRGPYVELVMSLDKLEGDGAEADHGIGGIGTGGDGAGGAGRGDMPGIPEPPSLAHGPRAKYDYSEAAIRGARNFEGQRIEVVLSIDARGVVRGARIVKSVSRHFDLLAVNKALHFEFEPALDARGTPIPSKLPWSFVMTL